MLSYHATAPLEDGVKLSKQTIPSTQALQLNSFVFDDFGLDDKKTLQVLYHIEIYYNKSLELVYAVHAFCNRQLFVYFKLV